MILKDIPKDHAEKLLSAIAALRPAMKVRIVAEDTTLYRLGLSQSVLCSLAVDENDEAIKELVDEVYQMEVDAYNFSENELRDKETVKWQKKLERRYSRYAIIVAYLDN